MAKAKPRPVYVNSPGGNPASAKATTAAAGKLASAAGKPLAPPPVLQPGVRGTPGVAYVPGEPGMGSGPGGSGAPAAENTSTGDAAAPPAAPEIDWAKVYFGQYNLPSDLIDQIETLGKQYGTTNPDVFYQSALNTVRGSDWFKTTYPGFAAGVRAGLFTDETGYRGYVSSLNSVYQQYLGRAVSGDETAAALAQGASPTLIGNQFQGDAIAKTQGGQWQYLTGAFDENGMLTSAEQTALGREQAGIDTPLGQMVQKRVQQAMGRAQTLFGGTLATPSLTLAQGRLSAPGLGASATPDIGA